MSTFLSDPTACAPRADDLVPVDPFVRRDEPYLFAARTMQVQPNRLALVPAHAWDTHGAHEAGLITGWTSVLEKQYQPAFHPADVSEASPDEVVAALVSER